MPEPRSPSRERQQRCTWHAFTATLSTWGDRGYQDGPIYRGESRGLEEGSDQSKVTQLVVNETSSHEMAMPLQPAIFPNGTIPDGRCQLPKTFTSQSHLLLRAAQQTGWVGAVKSPHFAG